MLKTTQLIKQLFVAILMISTFQVTAQDEPFNCDYNAYLFQYNDVYAIDLASGNAYLVAEDVTPGNINAAAYNPADGYIWGSLSTPAKSIVRIGKNFDTTVFTIDELPSSNRYVGDISAEGIYYLKAGGTTYYSVDLNPDSPNYGEFIDTHQMSQNINIHDWAFNAVDGYLYTVEKGSNRLYRMDAASGQLSVLGEVPILSGNNYTYGAVYFDADGRFYVSANQTGSIYIIQEVQNLTGSNAMASNIFAFGPSSSLNDGARCPTAPVPQEDCTNGIDDDGDGLIDCEDPSCSGYAACPVIDPEASSANDGGLESNNRLAEQINKRNFNRVKTSHRFEKSIAPRVEKTDSYGTRSNNTIALQDFIPLTLIEEDYVVDSSPTDLIGITNAVDIYSVDYIKDDISIASIMAIETIDGVYEHTKYICDRLLGGELINTSTIEINEHTFIKSLIKNPDGTVEFVMSLSARKTDQESFAIESHWNLDKYTDDASFYNFQIWANSIDDLYVLGTEILNLVEIQKPIVSYDNSTPPTVFVRKGKYLNGQLELQIVNTNNTPQVTFDAGARSTETSEFVTLNSTIDIQDQYIKNIVVETGYLFDIGFRIGDGINTPDDLFMSDGPWGVDDNAFSTTVNNYEITTNTEAFENNVLPVERNVNINVTTQEYVSVYRALTPRFQPVDLTAYDAIKFKASGTGNMEVRLVKSSIEVWEEQFVKTIPLNEVAKEFTIPFEQFTSIAGSEINPNDIVTVVFTMVSEDGSVMVKQMNLEQVRFTETETLSLDDIAVNETTGLSVYPNPVQTKTTISFASNEAEDIEVIIYNQLGQIVESIDYRTVAGRNDLTWRRKSLNTGIYFIGISGSSSTYDTIKLLVK